MSRSLSTRSTSTLLIRIHCSQQFTRRLLTALCGVAIVLTPAGAWAQSKGKINVTPPPGPVPASINSERLNALLDEASQAIDAKRFEAAARAYEAAIPLDEKNPRLYSALGFVNAQRGDFDGSAVAFRRAVALESGNADFHLGLGYALANLDDLKAASQAYRRAIQEDSKKYEAYIGLGTVLRREEKFDEAIAVYSQLRALQPRDWRPYEAIGTMQIQKRKYTEALAVLKLAEQYAPSNASVQVSKAVALLGLGRPSEGVGALERAAKIEPGNPQILLKLGEVYETLNKDELALQVYRRATSLNPDLLEARARVAKLHMANREFTRAMVIYEEILRKAPEDGESYYNLALALRGRDRNKEAKEALKKAERIFKREGNRERLKEAQALLKQLR